MPFSPGSMWHSPRRTSPCRSQRGSPNVPLYLRPIVSDQTNEDRERTAHDLAVEEGRRRERVDGQLEAHQGRLDRINGSLERADKSLRAVASKVDEIAAQLGTREKLDKQRADDLEKTRKAGVTRLQLWLAAAAIAAPQLYQLVHGSH